MLEQVKKNITTRNRTVYNNRQILYIGIHYTGALGSAYANSKYFKTTYRGASAHYFVDENDIYQVVEDKDAAWHIGANKYYHPSARNRNSIGIEMCCYKDKNGKLQVSENVENRTIELVKDLMKKYNIPATNVIRHYDVTHKNCPAPMVENTARWVNFKNKLNKNDKFIVGGRCLVDIPVGIAQFGEKNLVDSNGYLFWIHSSVVIARNNQFHVYGLADILEDKGNNLYRLKIFDDEFDCRTDYMSDKY